MTLDSLQIKYPESYPGTELTKINFYDSIPDLIKLYNPGKSTERRCFVTDATVATLPTVAPFINCFDDGKCGEDILIILGSGESYKTIDSVLNVIKAAIDAEFARKDIFVGIGGGVICDLTGFAASLFKRGAKVQFVPTTLLAMVDASIGGKTGCDFDNYKNMVGCFFPAQEIHIFSSFVQSLSQDQFRSGLAEAVKTALLYDKELFELFKTEKEKITNRDEKLIDQIIQKCAKAKANVVEKDFTEKNIRMYLNFGHTFGHALETIIGLGKITHGDAVAWGMARALDLCAKKEFCKESYKNEVFEVLKAYGWETTATHPLIIGGGTAERIINAMHKDKKNSNSKIKLVLQKGITETFTEEIDDKDLNLILKS